METNNDDYKVFCFATDMYNLQSNYNRCRNIVKKIKWRMINMHKFNNVKVNGCKKVGYYHYKWLANDITDSLYVFT